MDRPSCQRRKKWSGLDVTRGASHQTMWTVCFRSPHWQTHLLPKCTCGPYEWREGILQELTLFLLPGRGRGGGEKDRGREGRGMDGLRCQPQMEVSLPTKLSHQLS